MSSRCASRPLFLVALTGLCLFLVLSGGPLHARSTFLNVLDSFKSVDEITKPANQARIRTMAALADMSMAEFANFAIKRLVIRLGVLEQPVIIEIDGKNTPLLHPHPCVDGIGLPLHYSDFVVDRSGPKFLGALDAEVAVETLMEKDAELKAMLTSLNEKRDPSEAFETDIVAVARRLAKARIWGDSSFKNFPIAPAETLPRKTGRAYLELKDLKSAKVDPDDVTTVFLQKHLVQRRLSDFDLTARETETFALAIGKALGKLKSGTPSREFILEIGRIAWQIGGPIDRKLIDAALAAETASAKTSSPKTAIRFYNEAIASDPRFIPAEGSGSKYYHVLFHEVGPLVGSLLKGAKPKIDAGYGLGIPYFGPEVEEGSDGVLKPSHPEEIGDIICDETSHYGAVFSHNILITSTLEKLKKTDDIGVKKTLNLRDNFNVWLRKFNATEYQEFMKESAFIDTILMFEQIAKKEAQSQLFKVEASSQDAKKKKKGLGKLMGNVSDVGQFLLGASKLDNSALYVDVVKLSCLVAMPRWGINASNLSGVRDTAAVVTAQEFAQSINERSYCHLRTVASDGRELLDPLSPRLHLEWAGIDEKTAQQRLDDFRNGMTPVWEFIQRQGTYFGLVDAFIQAIRNNRDLRDQRTAIRRAVATILSGQLSQLHAKIDATGKLEAFLDSITDQVETTARFFLMRTRAR